MPYEKSEKEEQNPISEMEDEGLSEKLIEIHSELRNNYRGVSLLLAYNETYAVYVSTSFEDKENKITIDNLAFENELDHKFNELNTNLKLDKCKM